MSSISTGAVVGTFALAVTLVMAAWARAGDAWVIDTQQR